MGKKYDLYTLCKDTKRKNPRGLKIVIMIKINIPNYIGMSGSKYYLLRGAMLMDYLILKIKVSKITGQIR